MAGFREEQNLIWDTETASPSITIEYTLSDGWDESMKRLSVPFVGGIIERKEPEGEGHVDLVYQEPVTFQLDKAVELSVEGRYVGGQLVLGSYTAYTEIVDGQQVTLFVPGGVEMATPPEKVITALAATERTIEGDPHRDPYLFVFEGQGIDGGASYQRARVSSGSPLSTYIHEFVHVNYVTNENLNMTWFTEANAQYYSMYFEVSDGKLRIKPTEVLKRTDPATEWPKEDHHNDSTLAEPATWDRNTDYIKGQRLLFALDAKLRAATDGEATIHDLMRRVNSYEADGSIDYRDFRAIVVELSNEETASWLDPYVLTTQNPPQPNASAFGPSPKFANGTTNMSGDSRDAFEFAISIPSGERQWIESVTLSIDTGETSVEAIVSDGNDDGRVDIRFQPYGPDEGAVLEVADSADKMTITNGTLEKPVVSESIQIDLRIADTSGSYTIATRSIRLESIPAELVSTPTVTRTETSTEGSTPKQNSSPVFGQLFDRLTNLTSSLSLLDLVIGIPLAVIGVYLMRKGD